MEEHAVEHQVRRAGGLVQAHISAPGVLSGEMKDHAHVLDGLFCALLLSQIRLHEFDAAGVDVPLDVVELSAAQIIHHANARAL